MKWTYHRLTNLTLRTKMIVLFLTITLLSLGLLTFLYTQTMQAALTDKANQTLFAAASRTAVRLDTFIGDNLDAIRIQARLPDVVEYLNLPPDQRSNSQKREHLTEPSGGSGQKSGRNRFSTVLPFLRLHWYCFI